jgi:hypothetical protein
VHRYKLYRYVDGENESGRTFAKDVIASSLLDACFAFSTNKNLVIRGWEVKNEYEATAKDCQNPRISYLVMSPRPMKPREILLG